MLKVLSAALSSLAVLMPVDLAQAAEVSFVSGLYKSEDRELDGEDAGRKSTIEVGGRYSEALDSQWHWFGQGTLALRSYSGAATPSDSTSLNLAGGLRFYFDRFGESSVPFVYGYGAYRNDKDSDSVDLQVVRETSGLFYGAHAGVRLNLSTLAFLDIETQLFDSALFATETTERATEAADGSVTKRKYERTRSELYVNTNGAFATTLIAFGIKL